MIQQLCNIPCYHFCTIAKSACWWWREHGLNEISDTGDFKRVTKIINGGYNGLADREKLYEAAKKVLGI